MRDQRGGTNRGGSFQFELRRRSKRRKLRIESLETRRVLAATPMLLADIAPGAGDANPRLFTEFNGATYFAARQTQLWVTDGTVAGTSLVRDFGTGDGLTLLEDLYVHDNTLVVARHDWGSDGLPQGFDDNLQIYTPDGTDGGTSLLVDFSAGSSPTNAGLQFTSIGSTLFMSVNTTSSGSELWTTTNFAAPQLLKEIAGGLVGSEPQHLTVFQSKLYFSAGEASNGVELWTSDGTTAGTVLLNNLASGFAGSYPTGGVDSASFPVMNDQFYFGARGVGPDNLAFTVDDTNQLWKSDGTTAGTVLVKDFGTVGDGYADPPELIAMGDLIIGTVSTVSEGRELWKSDGTTTGTELLKDINPSSAGGYGASSSVRELTKVGGTLFFSADDGVHGQELWKSDGTTGGTVLVQDIAPGSNSGFAISSEPKYLTEYQGQIFFSAYNELFGEELWRSDGTAQGTVITRDIASTSGSVPFGSYPEDLAVAGGRLYFSASDEYGAEPWVIADTLMYEDLTMRHPDGRVYVARSTGRAFENQRWATWSDLDWEDTLAGDVNGDGFSDVIARHPNGTVYVGESTGQRFVTRPWATWADVDWADTVAGDFNGDGRTDLASRYLDGRVYVALSDGTKFSTSPWATVADIMWRNVTAGDFNGDGRDDLFMRSDMGGFYVLTSEGTHFLAQKWLTGPTVFWQDGRVGDFTGDGLPDVALRTPAGQVYVAVNTGSQFVLESWTVWANVEWQDVTTGDFNGDNRLDLSMRHPNGTVFVALSSGSSFVNIRWTHWADLDWQDVTSGDFNGDGLSDLTMRHPNGTVYVSTSTGGSFSNRPWSFWENVAWEGVRPGDFTVLPVADLGGVAPTQDGDSGQGNVGGALTGPLVLSDFDASVDAVFGASAGPVDEDAGNSWLDERSSGDALTKEQLKIDRQPGLMRNVELLPAQPSSQPRISTLPTTSVALVMAQSDWRAPKVITALDDVPIWD